MKKGLTSLVIIALIIVLSAVILAFFSGKFIPKEEDETWWNYTTEEIEEQRYNESWEPCVISMGEANYTYEDFVGYFEYLENTVILYVETPRINNVTKVLTDGCLALKKLNTNIEEMKRESKEKWEYYKNLIKECGGSMWVEMIPYPGLYRRSSIVLEFKHKTFYCEENICIRKDRDICYYFEK